MNLGQYQKRAVKAAARRLKRHEWFDGVCISAESMPTEDECKKDFKGSVERLVMVTEMWDNPDAYR